MGLHEDLKARGFAFRGFATRRGLPESLENIGEDSAAVLPINLLPIEAVKKRLPEYFDKETEESKYTYAIYCRIKKS